MTTPPAPEHLEGEALLEWGRVCEHLQALGRLETVDRAALVLYVEAWAAWRECNAYLAHMGRVQMAGTKAALEEDRLAKRVRGMLRDLGLTCQKPAAAESDDDELEF